MKKAKEKGIGAKKTTITSPFFDIMGWKLVALGDGKTVVTAKVYDLGFPVGHLGFSLSGKKRKIGEAIKRRSIQLDLPEVSISFCNTESVDVVLKALIKIKKEMKQIDKSNQPKKNNKNLVLKSTSDGWVQEK